MDLFGENIFKYFIVIFIRKDDFDEEGRSLEDYIKSVFLNLYVFIEKCGNRVIVFNNRFMGKDSDE